MVGRGRCCASATKRKPPPPLPVQPVSYLAPPVSVSPAPVRRPSRSSLPGSGGREGDDIAFGALCRGGSGKVVVPQHQHRPAAFDRTRPPVGPFYIGADCMGELHFRHVAIETPVPLPIRERWSAGHAAQRVPC